MAFDIDATCVAVQAWLVDSSIEFQDVSIRHPETVVAAGPVACIYPQSMRVVETTLTNPIELHVIKLNLYRAKFTVDDEERVLEAPRLASQVADLVYEDFTLGGRVRNVDIGGQYGEGFSVEFTDEDIQETTYHTAVITLPLIVDSGTAFVA